MYIPYLEIKNIRSISHFIMEFPKGKEAGWHVLIGENGAGKSSIVRAIALAIIGPMEAQALRLPLINWIKKNEESSDIFLTIQRDNFHDGYASKKAPLKRPFDVSVKIEKENSAGFEIGKLNGNDKPSTNPYEYIWSGKRGWFSASFGPFRRFTGGDKEWSKVYYSSPRAAAHLSVFGEDIALTESLDWLSHMKFQSFESVSSATDTLEAMKIFINDGELLPKGVKMTEVSSAGVFFNDANGFEVDVTQMSDGFRSLLSMIFELIRQMVKTYGEQEVFKDILANKHAISLPGVVLIDEIDAHLHPTWQTRIGHWFTKYFPGVQFIVTTHSPLICRGCLNEDGELNGSIWRLAAPGSSESSGQLDEVSRDRLLFGNVLDAYGTGVFGTNTSRSKEGNLKMNRLAELNVKSMIGAISEKEESEMHELKTIFPTHA